MTNTIPTTRKVKEITGTRKANFWLSPTTSVSPRGGWSGGSCSYFSGLNYVTGETVVFKQGDYWRCQTEAQELPANTVMIETGTFCGKPATACIHYRPEEFEAVRAWLGIPFEHVAAVAV